MDKVASIITIIVIIFWFAAPFELYGINSKLDKILKELKNKSNDN